MVDRIRRGKGRLFLVAVHGRAGRKKQMLHRMVPAGFQHVEEADDVGVDVGPGMVDAVAHARLGRQIDDNIRGGFPEQFFHHVTIGDVALHKRELRELPQDRQAALLQRRIIIII